MKMAFFPALTDPGHQVVAEAAPMWKAEHQALAAELPGQTARTLVQMLAELSPGRG